MMINKLLFYLLAALLAGTITQQASVKQAATNRKEMVVEIADKKEKQEKKGVLCWLGAKTLLPVATLLLLLKKIHYDGCSGIDRLDIQKNKQKKKVLCLKREEEKWYKKKRTSNWEKGWVDKVNQLRASRLAVFKELKKNCKNKDEEGILFWVGSCQEKQKEQQQQKEELIHKVNLNLIETLAISDELVDCQDPIKIRQQQQRSKELEEATNQYSKERKLAEAKIDRLGRNIRSSLRRLDLWNNLEKIVDEGIRSYRSPISNKSTSHQEIYEMVEKLSAATYQRGVQVYTYLYRQAVKKQPPLKGEQMEPKELIDLLNDMKAWTLEREGGVIKDLAKEVISFEMGDRVG